VGKQWMWKMEHPGGQREIDALHVPVDKTVRLLLASQDVIHSFFIPAFRIKHDAVPGQYETVWFKATKPGTYLIECSEFCGTEHAHMKGEVVVMEPAAFALWLRDQGVRESLAQEGEALFRDHGRSPDQLRNLRKYDQLVAADQGPQADRIVVLRFYHILLFHWRYCGDINSDASGDAGRPAAAGHLQPHVHDARHRHGVVLLD